MIPLAPVLGVLRSVPLWAWALAAAVAWGAWHRWRAIDARDEFKKAQEQAQIERGEAIVAAAKEGARRVTEQQGAINAKDAELSVARASAATAAAAGERLRAQLATERARCRAADPATAAASAPAGTAADMQDGVFAGIDGAVREIAAFADSARASGKACEAIYDSLRPAR